MNIDEETTATEHHGDGGTPDIGKAIGVGAVIGIVLAFVGVGGGSLLAGWEWSTAIGLAAFSAVWSGLGFGAMFGGIIYVTKLDASAEAEHGARRAGVAREATPDRGPRSATLA